VHAELAWPHTARLLAVSIPSWSPGWIACKEGTLFPELRTRLLPVTHVQVGNCWSYSRSQLQSPMFRLLSVTRQRRALPSTTLPTTFGGRRHASHLLTLLSSIAIARFDYSPSEPRVGEARIQEKARQRRKLEVLLAGKPFVWPGSTYLLLHCPTSGSQPTNRPVCKSREV
jgi:hypothetical protein